MDCFSEGPACRAGVLTRNAANQHEELEEKLAIKKNGYIETFVVNETSQDVWFDNFKILNQGSILVQETHYDPWGLELTGIGYEYAGVKKNKYLYQGKEMIDDQNLNIYDFHARGYDPVIGKTWQLDPHAENYFPLSPYSWVANNPLIFTDPTGMDINLGNLYEKENGKFKYESLIRAFEAFAASSVGNQWISMRAQQGFSLKFEFEKGGINVENEGELSSKVDYNFKVGEETSGGIALAEYNTKGNKLKIDLTFEKGSSERDPTDAFTFMQLSDAVFHETSFHGFHAENRYLNGERNVNKLSSGDHKKSDLQSSPFGQKAYSYYLYLVNKQITRTMPGFDKYSKYTNNNNETYKFWWRHFMGQFND